MMHIQMYQMRCCLRRFSISVAKHIWLSWSLILTSSNCYSFPKSLASVTSVIFNLTVVATSFLMEIFLTLISPALNLSTSIFFLSYCLWQRLHVTDRKKGIAASSLFSESTRPNLRQQESYRATYSIFFPKQ